MMPPHCGEFSRTLSAFTCRQDELAWSLVDKVGLLCWKSAFWFGMSCIPTGRSLACFDGYDSNRCRMGDGGCSTDPPVHNLPPKQFLLIEPRLSFNSCCWCAPLVKRLRRHSSSESGPYGVSNGLWPVITHAAIIAVTLEPFRMVCTEGGRSVKPVWLPRARAQNPSDRTAESSVQTQHTR